MGKGSFATVIIVVIIIGIVGYLLLPNILKGFQFPVGDGAKITYKNDIITVEDYSVSTLNPYAGSTSSISFSLTNNGDKEVSHASVYFFNLGGLPPPSTINCHGTELSLNKDVAEKPSLKGDVTAILYEAMNRYGCEFKNIKSLQSKRVSIVLQMPPEENIISKDTAFTVAYSVSYDYSGYRSIQIPVIDTTKVTEPISKYSVSSTTVGPIVLNFEAPVGRESIQNKKVVKEYWGRKDMPVEITMTFKHIGSSSVGKIDPLLGIEKGRVYLDLKGTLEVPKTGEGLHCDFTEEGGKIVSTRHVYLIGVDSPVTLRCNFKVPDMEDKAEYVAFVGVTFDYTYNFEKSQTFKVQPIE